MEDLRGDLGVTFDDAFERLIGHEGGYSNDSRDPGGETNWGISKRSYPRENIKDLTLDRAKAIYLRDFWKAAGCDHVPAGVRFDLFDMAVNSGVRPAVKTMQEAAGVVVDGVLGSKTIKALQDTDHRLLVMRFNGARLRFMTTLAVWPTYSRGWARRIASNLLEAQ